MKDKIAPVERGKYPSRFLQVDDMNGLGRERLDEYLRGAGELGGGKALTGRGKRKGSGANEEVIKYAEGYFFFGDLEVIVMVKLRLHNMEEEGRCRFYAVSNMVRIGWVFFPRAFCFASPSFAC